MNFCARGGIALCIRRTRNKPGFSTTEDKELFNIRMVFSGGAGVLTRRTWNQTGLFGLIYKSLCFLCVLCGKLMKTDG